MYFLGRGMLSYVTTVQSSSLVTLTLIQCFNERSIFEFCEFPFRSGPSLESGIAFSCHVSLDSFNLNISTDFVFYDIDIWEEHSPYPSTGVCVKVSMIRWRSCILSRDTSYVMPCLWRRPVVTCLSQVTLTLVLSSGCCPISPLQSSYFPLWLMSSLWRDAFWTGRYSAFHENFPLI